MAAERARHAGRSARRGVDLVSGSAVVPDILRDPTHLAEARPGEIDSIVERNLRGSISL